MGIKLHWRPPSPKGQPRPGKLTACGCHGDHAYTSDPEAWRKSKDRCKRCEASGLPKANPSPCVKCRGTGQSCGCNVECCPNCCECCAAGGQGGQGDVRSR